MERIFCDVSAELQKMPIRKMPKCRNERKLGHEQSHRLTYHLHLTYLGKDIQISDEKVFANTPTSIFCVFVLSTVLLNLFFALEKLTKIFNQIKLAITKM
jgi:hypothetical protein